MSEQTSVSIIAAALEEGVKKIYTGRNYTDYLNAMSRFHSYSYRNVMLIWMQRPDATLVAGYRAWQDHFQRFVRKGEKGIRILAPMRFGSEDEDEKKKVSFRTASVFDISQTEGKELPSFTLEPLSGDISQYDSFMDALSLSSPVQIHFEEIPGTANGFYSPLNEKIVIRPGMSQVQSMKTAIHEIAHALLLEADTGKDRNLREVEAESIAYVVCQHFGIDTSEYSFGYIAGYSADQDLPELKESLNSICTVSGKLIHRVELLMHPSDPS